MAIKKKKEERSPTVLEHGTVFIFEERFRCKVLSNKDGILTIENINVHTPPYPYLAICGMCNCLAELEKEYGIREVKLKLNQVPMRLTAANSQNSEKLFRDWETQGIKVKIGWCKDGYPETSEC